MAARAVPANLLRASAPAAAATVEEPACVRVDPAQARAFPGLELMGHVGAARVFGRRGQMLCSEPAAGKGECEVVGRS